MKKIEYTKGTSTFTLTDDDIDNVILVSNFLGYFEATGDIVYSDDNILSIINEIIEAYSESDEKDTMEFSSYIVKYIKEHYAA